MTRQEIEEKLKVILADILIVNEDEIRDDVRLVEDLDADSVVFLELSYRLQEEFGVSIPDPKVDEELLSLPMLQGLERLSDDGSGDSLFVHMRTTLVQPDDAETSRDALIEIIGECLDDEGFVQEFKRGVRSSWRDSEAGPNYLTLLREMSKHPDLEARIERLREEDGQVRVALGELERRYGDQVPEQPSAEEVMRAWQHLAYSSHRVGLANQLTADQLARLLETSLPSEIQPDTKLSELRVRDLFGFITVKTYVRYIELLIREREASAA